MELSGNNLIATTSCYCERKNSLFSSRRNQNHFLYSSTKKKNKYNRVLNLASTTSTPKKKLTPLRKRGSSGNEDKDDGSLESSSSSSAMEQLDFERGVCIPFRKYTPETVRNKVFESNGAVLSLIGRGVEIVWKLGIYWSALLSDFLIGRDQEVVPFRARQLRNLLCDLGPSFIKAGQVAFTIIEEELGQPLEAVFSKISSRTVAAASLGQVYRATIRDTGEEVAIKVTSTVVIHAIVSSLCWVISALMLEFDRIGTWRVQRPGIEPIIYRDLFLFRMLASFLNGISLQKLGCNAELIVDEFGEKLLEELDYTLEARNIEDFLENFKDDPTAIKEAGLDVNGFLTVGVSAALRQLLEFGLFHGDPHPGNVFAMRDGRIAYVDFGNVAQLSQQNKQILIDAVVHAVNEDYTEMANDFTRLGFLASGTDVTPIVPALEAIWQNSSGKGLADFNFRSVAYPYVAKRLLTDPNPALRERLIQVLFKDGLFQWKRLENLIVLAKENVNKMSSNPAISQKSQVEKKLDLTDTIKDGARVVLLDSEIRRKLLLALTEDSKLHIQELVDVYRLVQDDIDMPSVALDVVRDIPAVTRDIMLSWSNSVLNDL
ncbi:hypothetical protein C5167_008720 [Papaver somniferum]|uniref:Protein kinase domain-containing protein n=1 Tax=Papaver somniferum TaxID=3469 RepID=A0A4Y7JYB6_PAPSO|nr:hypothetical protein C5167_008720 [Papaver somniferum]